MPVSDALWSRIESEIPLTKERPKVWLLFLVFAFLTPVLYFSLTGVSNPSHAEASNQQASIDLTNDLSQKPFNNNGINEDAKDYNRVQNELNSTRNLRVNETSFENFTKENNKNTNRAFNNLSSNNRTRAFTTNRAYKRFPSNASIKSTSQNENKNKLQLIEKRRFINPVRNMVKLRSLTSVTNYIKSKKEIHETKNKFLADLKADVNEYAPGCPQVFNLLPNGIYVYADIAGSKSNPSFSGSASFNDIIEQKNTAESSSLSYSASFGIGHNWDSGLVSEIGLNFNQLNTSFSYNEIRILASSMITIDTIYNDTGGYNITRDTTHKTENIPYNRTNVIKMVDLPIKLGYRIPINKNLALTAKGGLNLNLFSTNSGLTFGNEGDIITYGTDSNEEVQLYKTNLGISYTGEIDIDYKIWDRFSLYGGLRVHHYPSNFSLNSNAIQLKFTSIGANMGLKYRL